MSPKKVADITASHLPSNQSLKIQVLHVHLRSVVFIFCGCYGISVCVFVVMCVLVLCLVCYGLLSFVLWYFVVCVVVVLFF